MGKIIPAVITREWLDRFKLRCENCIEVGSVEMHRDYLRDCCRLIEQLASGAEYQSEMLKGP